MEEVGELRYLKWEEYTRRNQENVGVKKDKFWAEDADGRLKCQHLDPELRVSVASTDLLAAKSALQRRGLAMNMARLLSFESHEVLVNYYFNELSREALADHSPVSIEQVRLADKEVFFRMAEMTRGGFSKIVHLEDELPLDSILKTVMSEQRVQALLNPYRTVSARQASSGHSGGQDRGVKRL